jgi:NADH:ubiquinone oxidoreductase subunit E
VQQAVPALDPRHATTLVLNGDVPLIRAATAQALVDAAAQTAGSGALALLTIELAECLGACDGAPCILLEDELHLRCSLEDVERIANEPNAPTKKA